MMRAVVVRAFGGPEVLRVETVRRPRPAATEVLVRVLAAGVNPVDWKTRARRGLLTPPFIPGWDVAGVVEAVGFGVTRFQVGDRVFGMPSFPKAASAYAEFAPARSRQLARIPDGLDHREAAALPLAGLTAYQALVDTAALGEGSRVLVLAAAGGVGHLAVQIAKAVGAEVVASARRPHHARLEALGADAVVDAEDPDALRSFRGVDVVLGLVDGRTGASALTTLRDGGRYINIPAGGDADLLRAAAGDRVVVTNLLVEPDRLGMEALARLAAEGRFRASVARTFPLEEAEAAHETGEAGRTGGGKLVLTTEPEGGPSPR